MLCYANILMPHYMHPPVLTCEFLIRGPLSQKDSWGQGDHELDSFHFCAFGVPEKPYKTSGLAAEETTWRVTWLGFAVRGRPRDYRERPSYLPRARAELSLPAIPRYKRQLSGMFQPPDYHSPHCHHVKQKNHQQAQSILIL